MSESNSIALVLGGHINGYSIIKELYEQKIGNIALFCPRKSIARFSNRVSYKVIIDNNNPEILLDEINKLHSNFDYIVIYPTDDLQIENLNKIYNNIEGFCYLPFNKDTILQSLDKYYQYMICEKVGVPFPKTIHAKQAEDFEKIQELNYPLLIKPTKRKDITTNVFRNLYIDDDEHLKREITGLVSFIAQGIEFVISEFIPGDDTNIYAYICFRNQEGKILNEWRGKKLTQYPDNYGVFSSASNEAPIVVTEQGRLLVDALNAYGIVEPEFKYDHRDGRFKLMEVNLRSMMWHRTGSISGVKLHETQYLYATNKESRRYRQNLSERFHFILMLHEIPNLISRRGYWKHFKYNVFKGEKNVWAVFELSDIKPFVYSLFLLSKSGVVACLKRFGLR